MNALKLAVVIALAITASTGLALNHGDVRSKADPTAGAAQKKAGKFEFRLQGAGPKGRTEKALPLLWMPQDACRTARRPPEILSYFPARAAAACMA
jgi:hypothetical protein